MIRILLLEDDESLIDGLKYTLEKNGFSPDIARTTAQARFLLEGDVSYDLLLLDVTLPDGTGFDICTRIRTQTDIPVIFLTCRSDSMDELTGMLKGADDYITKPLRPPLLLARIAAVLKRTAKASESRTLTQFSHKNATLDTAACRLYFNGQTAELTKTEMKILHLLFTHAGAFVPREDLIEYLWENHIFLDDNTLSVHITRLREKLRSAGLDDFIETKRGMGYRI